MIAPFSKRRTALDDHLLRRLREDPPEAGGVELHADLVADLGVRVELARSVQRDLRGVVGHLVDDLAELEELDLPQLIVELGFDLLLLALLAPGGLLHRLFEGSDDLLRIDALVLGDLLDFSLQPDHAHSNGNARRRVVIALPPCPRSRRG